jgi:RsiW-degrading membrane proteinase PrsW (M82 family)
LPVLLAQLLLAVVFAALLFFDMLSDLFTSTDADDWSEVELPRNFRFWLFFFLLSYVVAAGTEESLKFLVTRGILEQRPQHRAAATMLLGGVTAALGFSTIENVMYVLGAVNSSSSVAAWAFELASRLLVASPLHCLTGFLIGIGIAKRDVYGDPGLPWWRILLAPVLIHGTYDMVQFVWAFNTEHLSSWLQIVGSLGLALLVLGVSSIYARKQYQGLHVHEHISSILASTVPIAVPMEDLDDDGSATLVDSVYA